MNLKSDFVDIVRQSLISEGITVHKDWNDLQICVTYLELHQRWFDSTIKYDVFYSQELLKKLPKLNQSEREAIKDIENRLKTCKEIKVYMSKDLMKTEVEKSDFLLKNWNIYHLHLEKAIKGKPYTNPNLLFIQKDKDKVYFIDVKKHPKGQGWFDKGLFEIIDDNWPHLLKYLNGIKCGQPVSDDKMHNLLKQVVTIIDFRGKALIPTNGGASVSGRSSSAVTCTDRVFKPLEEYEDYLKSNENEMKKKIFEVTGIKVEETLDYKLVIENGFCYAKEIHSSVMFKLFELF